jgi:hypothetical protein
MTSGRFFVRLAGDMLSKPCEARIFAPTPGHKKGLKKYVIFR